MYDFVNLKFNPHLRIQDRTIIKNKDVDLHFKQVDR